MHYDLSTFDVRNMPKTEALQAQKEQSFTPIEEWWYSKLQDGEIHEGGGWPAGVPRSTMRDSLVAYTRAFGVNLRSSSTALGVFMKKVFPDDWDNGRSLSGTYTVINDAGEPVLVSNPRGYRMPPLEVCRDRWEEIFGGKFIWQEAPGVTETQGNLGLQEEHF